MYFIFLEHLQVAQIKEKRSKLTQQVNFWEAKVKEKKRTVDAQMLKLNETKLNIRCRNEKSEIINTELSELQENVMKRMNQLNQALAYSRSGSNPFSTQHVESLEQEIKALKNEITQLTVPNINKNISVLKQEYFQERKALEKECDQIRQKIEKVEREEETTSEQYNGILAECHQLFDLIQSMKCASCGQSLVENEELDENHWETHSNVPPVVPKENQ